jgi:hypothetical protein
MTKPLAAADYWKLRAICGDARLCEALARQARDAFATADQKQAAALEALGLDPNTPSFTLDDVALTITVPEAAP